MQLKNVKLIYFREMRDQLRDRRTLFLIAVLPLLLYPLLGTSFYQLMQFVENKAHILVIGGDELQDIDWLPPLVEGERFAQGLFDNPLQGENLVLRKPQDFPNQAEKLAEAAPPEGQPDEAIDAVARQLLDGGKVDAVLQFPPGFGARLREMRQALLERKATTGAAFPEPSILYDSGDEKSQLTQMQVEQILRRWRSALTEENLSASDVPAQATRPFELRPRDVARVQAGQAAVWSKALPFFVFIWALTGAFYPAVDLCAGEKERGTLETLLTSPASRREIVWGKLLTVMTFSIMTALLNLGSLGITGRFVIDRMSGAGILGKDLATSLPSLGSVLWLAIALIPISALFGALCLACAAFARSTKEGQYYLMPLMLVTMPLMFLSMSPGVELTLGNSLIPVTGMVLLLRSIIEGQYHQTLPFIVPVMGVTLICCLLAIRWAEEQFNRESVLFRESERLELGRWLMHLVRDRGDTPSFAQAALCIAVILVVKFFVTVSSASSGDGAFTFEFFTRTVLISQIACILAPAAIMTVMLTRNPWRTLLLERAPKWKHVVGAVALGALVHPIAMRSADWISRIYPASEETIELSKAITGLVQTPGQWWTMLALIAVLAPICEEVAFRGFILSGARHLGHKWWAIAVSAVAFGLVHMVLQQQIMAAAVGMVIGYLAVQTGSLVPCIVYHAVHNALQISLPGLVDEAERQPDSLLAWLLGGSEPLLYNSGVVALCALCAGAILWSLHGVTYRRTAEEALEEARQRQDSPLVSA